jgi:hypothetical protein
LIIGAVVVYGTALVVAGTLATGGALFAAPAAATSAGLVGPTGLAVEGSASELGYGLARSLARETLKNATLPVLEEALPIGERIGQQFTREAAQRVAQQEIDLVLSRELRAAAQSQLQDVVAKRAAAEVKKEVTTTAIAAGGATLAAVALRFAAEGAPANTPGAVPTGPMATVAAEVGSLHLLKLYDDADINKLPQLYAKADYSRFSPEQPGGPRLTPNPPPPQQYFHLGVIKCL